MNFIEDMLNIIFPPICIICGKHIKTNRCICDDCFRKISVNQTLFCGKCGSRLPYGRKVCHFGYPYVLGAAAEYNSNSVKMLIHNLKFKFIKGAAYPLAEKIVEYIKILGIETSNYLIVPIPLGKKRMRERGFNQSELIARIVADRINLQVNSRVLVRKRDTKPQSSLDIEERINNVEGCFYINDKKSISGRNIFIIDDVCTSGSTLYEAAKCLKSSGAKKIIALTAARA